MICRAIFAVCLVMCFGTTKAKQCGGTLDVPYGVITTPGYPFPYADSTTCEWNIVAPDGWKIVLMSRDFELEHQAKCKFDYLEVFENDKSKGRACGLNTISYKSSSKNVQLVFQSNSRATYAGFQIIYFFDCGADLFLPMVGEGKLLLGQQGKMSSSTSSQWPIHVPRDHTMEVKLVFHVSHKADCKSNSVQITEMFSNGPEVIDGPYCKDNDTHVITSSAQCLWNVFHADEEGGQTKFSASWTAKCGTVRDSGTEGVITSPLFPHQYSNNEYCEWKIVPPAGKSVNIIFRTFQLEPDTTSPKNCTDCSCDYVELFDDQTSLARGCGEQWLKQSFASAENKTMGVVFRADKGKRWEGFKAIYAFV